MFNVKPKLTRKIQMFVTATIIAISGYTMSSGIGGYADTGVTIQLAGLTSLSDYAVTGTYYNIGSSEKVQTTAKTDSDGRVYFAIPSETYTEFDYSLIVSGFEVTGTKSVSEIQSESKSVILADVSWATALSGVTEIKADGNNNDNTYNTIGVDGDVHATDETKSPIETTEKDNTKDTADTKTENASITVNVKSSAILDLLRESCNVTLTGVNGSANINVKFSSPVSTISVKLPDGVYTISLSATTNKVKAPTECKIVNGMCNITLEVTPVCVLIVSDADKTDTLYVFKGNKNTYITDGTPLAVENKRNYILKRSGENTGYSLTIPTYADKLWFDFVTGEMLTDKTDNTAETPNGTEDNPYGIAETMDKGYNNNAYKCIIVGVTLGMLFAAYLCLCVYKRKMQALDS